LEKGHYLRIPSDLAVAIDDDHCLIPWLDRVGDGGCGGWGWCGWIWMRLARVLKGKVPCLPMSIKNGSYRTLPRDQRPHL